MKKFAIVLTVACLVVLGADRAWAAPLVLDFEDLAGSGDVPFFTPYQHLGFTLTDINPPTGFNAGFQPHGAGSVFFMGSTALAAFAPATSPDNLITLTRDGGLLFSVTSIDLARNFAFDPAPTVTFTGHKLGGGTVTQAFTVTTPAGVAAFQTFMFTGFTDLVSLEWGQPPLAQGMHQFDDIALDTQDAATVPEPSTIVLCGLGLVLGAVRRRATR